MIYARGSRACKVDRWQRKADARAVTIGWPFFVKGSNIISGINVGCSFTVPLRDTLVKGDIARA